MKMFRIFLVIIFMLCNTLATYSVVFEQKGVCYMKIDGTNDVMIVGNPNGYSGEVVIPKLIISDNRVYTVTGIYHNAFYCCTNLTSINIPNSVESIGDYAFFGCTNLTGINIPNSVESIGSYAFKGCESIQTVVVPARLTNIGLSAFDNTGWYNNLPEGEIYLGNWFYGNKGEGGSEVYIKSGTLGIAGGAFANYSGLISINIPNSVVSIGDYAFSWCNKLTSITIPNGVESIGNRIFMGCDKLVNIEVESGNLFYDSRGGCNAIIETATNTLVAGCKNTIIPSGVENIGDNAFEYCDLTNITIPNSVVRIGDCAFAFCDLTNITIPNSVVSIGDYAFSWCNELTSIIIPNSVESIGGSAFEECSELTGVTISNSVISIGKRAFMGCSGIASMEVESGNLVYDSRGGCNAIIETATNTLVAGCKNTIIPNGVVNIGDYAFYGCEGLRGREGLTSITIPNSIKSIGDYAFYGCSNLTNITIPNSVESIGSFAFAGYSFSLASIEVENGNLFYDSREGCNAIIETGTNTLIKGCKNTIIPNGVVNIGAAAFYYCLGLTSITIPNSVASIGDGAFYLCI